MDASAYLQKHGWRGEGYSLDLSDHGIKKPLLISKKVDVLGVGLNKHAAVSDQWWLRAFDEGLKNFGTKQESTLACVQKHGVNRGGLYARFTQSQSIPSTFELSKSESVSKLDDIPKQPPSRTKSAGSKCPPRHLDADSVCVDSGVKVGQKRKRHAEIDLLDSTVMVNGQREVKKLVKAKRAKEDLTCHPDPMGGRADRRKSVLGHQVRELVQEARKKHIFPCSKRKDDAEIRGFKEGNAAPLHFSSNDELQHILQELSSKMRTHQASEAAEKLHKGEFKRFAKAYLRDNGSINGGAQAGADGASTAQEFICVPTKSQEAVASESRKKNTPSGGKKPTDASNAQSPRVAGSTAVETSGLGNRRVPSRKEDTTRLQSGGSMGSTTTQGSVVNCSNARGNATAQISGTVLGKSVSGVRNPEARLVLDAVEHTHERQLETHRSRKERRKPASGDTALGSQVSLNGMSPAKLDKYKKRAVDKGITLEDYLVKRQQKKAR